MGIRLDGLCSHPPMKSSSFMAEPTPFAGGGDFPQNALLSRPRDVFSFSVRPLSPLQSRKSKPLPFSLSSYHRFSRLFSCPMACAFPSPFPSQLIKSWERSIGLFPFFFFPQSFLPFFLSSRIFFRSLAKLSLERHPSKTSLLVNLAPDTPSSCRDCFFLVRCFSPQLWSSHPSLFVALHHPPPNKTSR